MVNEFNYFAGKPFSRGGYRTLYLRDTSAPTKEADQAMTKSHKMFMSKRSKSVPPLHDGRKIMIAGETMYAGQQEVLGYAGMPNLSKAPQYYDDLFEEELLNEFQGNLDVMSHRHGKDPIFVKWRQKKVTGDFEDIRKRQTKAHAEAERKKLLSIAFEMKQPLTATQSDTIQRRENGVKKMLERAVTEVHVQRSSVSIPLPHKTRRRSIAKERPLSKKAQDALIAIQHKLEEMTSSVNNAFHQIDKNHTGSISNKEFRFIVQERFNLPISNATIDEILHRFDTDGSGMVEFAEIVNYISSAAAPSSKDDFLHLDESGLHQGKVARSAAPPASNEDVIVRLMRRSLSERADQICAEYSKIPHATHAGHLTRNELQVILKKCNINLEPSQFAIFYATLDKNEHGAVSWKAFKSSIQSGSGANARKVGGVDDGIFLSRNVERVTLPPWFVTEPNYSTPNKWDMHGTWKHPGGAGFDNRRIVGYYALTTTKKGLDGNRGPITALTDSEGLKKVRQGALPPQLVFQKHANSLSGFQKVHGMFGEEPITQIMGDRFVPELRAATTELGNRWLQVSKPRQKDRRSL